MAKKSKTRNPQKTRNTVLIIVILLVIAYFKFISPIVKEYNNMTSVHGELVVVEIQEGDSVNDIAEVLEEKGLIDSTLAFRLRYRNHHSTYGELQFGVHNLRKGMCIHDILTELSKPASAPDITLVIPEGFSVEMIAARVEQEGICTYDEFIDAVKVDDYGYDFIKQIPSGNYKYKLEGFLFPNTYHFNEGVTARQVVEQMLASFHNAYTANFGNNYDNLFDVMRIASLVEREAALDSERATIAGVIKNRLSVDMLLQVDATVVYAKSAGRYDMTKVFYEDLNVDSLYNTYKYKGLPPGPICNPGIKSIAAAKSPESHGYIYYHTDEVKKDGSHIFTETYEQHLATQ